MPRPERPVDPEDGPVARFAVGLRDLRKCAGGPGYRELARAAHYSPTTLAHAARGMSLPSLAVTRAYVRVCGGDVAEWEERWRATAAELGPHPLPDQADGGLSDGRAPYLGLTAYGPQDAEWFCGRDNLVAALTDRVARQRIVAVVGASRSSKSSILRAGLLPSLFADGDRWSTLIMTSGAHPLQECAVQVGAKLRLPAGWLGAEFAKHPHNLGLAIRQLMAPYPDSAELVLIVDQFEEVFTLCQDEQERNLFIAALVDAAHGAGSRTRVVMGLRADFYAHCARHPQLVEALQEAQMLVGPMSTDELIQVVTQPAAHAGLIVEKTLVTTVVHDVAERPGALPFLSHALWETWRRRHGNGLFLADYKAAGGVDGAVAQTADRLYNDLDVRQQHIARGIFLRLTALGEGTEDTRRRVPRDEVVGSPNSEAVAGVLARLAIARLITLDSHTIEIAHEALIRGWPALREWLTEDRDALRAHRRLTEVAAEWERHDRDESLLYRGAHLTAWTNRPSDRLNDAEQEFLTASHRTAEREHRQRRRRVRLTIGGLGAATAVVTVLAVIALLMATSADHERAVAQGRQLIADARAQLQLDPELGLLLAREAYATAPNDDTEAVLRQATANSHIRATLPRNKSRVTGVAFSSDGKHLATSDGGTLRVWDWDSKHGTPSTLRRSLEIEAPFDGMSAVDALYSPVFSADNRRIAAIDPGGVVWMWDWSGQGDLTSFGAHHNDRPVLGGSVTFSPDSQRLASTGTDGVIEIWNTAGDDQPYVLRGHVGPVFSVSFNPDGKRLASSGADGTIRVWDLVSGGNPLVLRGHDGLVLGMAFSPDGRHVATTGADGTVRTWDTAGTADSVTIGSHDGTGHSIAYSSDGLWIASAGSDGTVKIWNANHRAAPVVLRGHRGAVSAVAWSPDNKSVASIDGDGTARIWDVDEVDDVTVLRGTTGSVSNIAPHPDEGHVASGGQDGTVRIWDIAGHRAPIVLHGHNHPVTKVVYSPDGRYLASLDWGHDLYVWNTSDLTKPPHHLVDATDIAFSPDSKRIAVFDYSSVDLWSTTWNDEPERLLYTTFTNDLSKVFRVAWSPNGEQLVASCEEGIVMLWDLRTRAKFSAPSVLPGHPGPSLTLSFNPQGTYLASGSDDGVITIWDMITTAEPTELRGHQGEIRDATFSADGRHLISSGSDGTVRIWQTDSISEPLVLNGFRAGARAVASLSNDRYVTAHDDDTIRIWRCDVCRSVAEVQAQANHHVTRQLTTKERQTYLPVNP